MLEVLGACVEKQTVKMQNGCVNNLDELPSPRVRPLPFTLTHTLIHVLGIFLVYVSLKNTYYIVKQKENNESEGNVPFAN